MKRLRKIIEIDEELCDGCGQCVPGCAEGSLQIINGKAKMVSDNLCDGLGACIGECPTGALRIVEREAEEFDEVAVEKYLAESALSHWPVQIRLVPTTALFLKGADLLVLADCCGIAIPTLHKDLLKGRVVMIGCPKFDDIQEYIDKFADIFKIADIKSVMAAVMEVPCCSGLPMIVKKGMEAAEKNVPIQELIIGTRGKMLSHFQL
ncbi:MAG: 4Fe-4S ferredoxin [Desulfobacterales bacterium]|uniref:4Fe-4S ferredoxin n=1 Tax=Candidatus Desulfaltia bathyphila TaxID=2841697 RepID=A0A8J6T6E9_9BACT|nr:4Fe-4S ferredoxin [Candidatus Desulfaltia bathyphila]MBL7196246.1 4Fe-4S ferredoxin [Desulfobacterales bacterium]MBL7207746.1 4Fe-4S ferredoxin [Desulfobacterales bacterium]